MAKKPITTAQDLPGITILGQPGTQQLLDALYRLNGLPPSYRFVPTGFDPGALVHGQGDAYTCYITNQPITLEEQYHLKEGSGYAVVTYAALGAPSYGDIVYCKRSYLDAHHDELTRFMRAVVQGWQDNATDPQVAAKLAVTRYGANLGLDLTQQTRENQLQIPLSHSALTDAHGLMRIDEALLATKMFPALRAAGVTKLPDPAKIVDTTVLDSVFNRHSTA